MQRWVTQLRKGVIELCVVAVLHKGESYGRLIVDQLNQAQGFMVTEATVYQVLSRLTREGLLRVNTATSPRGPVRKYYQLTQKGKARWGAMRQHWRQLLAATNALMK